MLAQASRLQQQQRCCTRGGSAHRPSLVFRRASVRTQAVADLLAQLPQASADTLAYAGLGLAAAMFCGTFFVAPRFKSAFKEDIDWMQIYSELVAQGVTSIEPKEAYSKRNRTLLLDVRLPAKYENVHAEGALGVPLYVPIQNWNVASNIRRAAFAFFAVAGTDFNKNFAAEVEAAGVPMNREIAVMCEMGGSLENKSGTPFGFQSQSLKAVYYLRRAGYSKVVHVKGGLSQWQRDRLPVESEGVVLEQQSALEPARSL